MAPVTADQAGRLYGAFLELVRHYQFRDRDRICCHGISVSQCYALLELAERGPLSMGSLAGALRLEVSSMTRSVDGLVRQELVERFEDEADRRVRRIRITERGVALMDVIRAESITEHQRILAEVPPESREAVIGTIERVVSAVKKCCKDNGCRSDNDANK